MLDRKRDFPIFANRPELVYLDSAATSQKPRAVLEAMRTYYEEYCANVSRGLYPTAELATLAVTEARERIARFIGSEPRGTVFVGSATHGINLVASGLREQLTDGDAIVTTTLEHHSNFLPWKELAQKTGSEFHVLSSPTDAPLTPDIVLQSLGPNTRVFAFSAVSNVLGLINPVAAIIRTIRQHAPDALVIVDACQAVGHIPVSLADWDADFIVFSGHKVFGPTGIGVLAGKPASLALLGAVNVGGGTILDPLATPAEYKALPEAIEGGTPNIAGIIGLGEAIRYIEMIGVAPIQAHEQSLLRLLAARLRQTFDERVRILGGMQHDRAGILSFTLDGIHPHDLAHLMGEEDICIRAGEHCARPLHQALDLPASARVSVSVYTTEADIEKLMASMERSLKLFSA